MCNEQPGGLPAALGRMVWSVAPSVRLCYHSDNDSVVAEFVQSDVVDEIVVLDQLLVEVDGTDDAAMPVAIYLTGLRACQATPAIALAKAILGPRVWSVVELLLADASSDPATELWLERDEATALRSAWWGLPTRLREQGRSARRMIGVELVPGGVYGVLTDAGANVLDEVVLEIDRNDPESVAEAIAATAAELARRNPNAGASRCPIGVQLGGPVSADGDEVEFYDKPLRDGDEPWKNVRLGQYIRNITSRPVVVFNDATALAAYEIETNRPSRSAKVAVLVVRDGIGAKLIRGGEVMEDYPMEIGIFVAGRAGRPRRKDMRRKSIEAKSGVREIVRSVSAVTGLHCGNIDEAARIAEHSEAARDVFFKAGSRLAAGIAAIESVVDPHSWAIYCAPALIDDTRPAGRAFLDGLERRRHHLDYAGLAPAVLARRPTVGNLGARAAAMAALRVQERGQSNATALHQG